MVATATTGFNLKTYRNSATYGSPTWNEITIVIDENLGFMSEFAQIISRATIWETNVPTKQKFDVKIKLLSDPAVDDYDVLRDAQIARTAIEFAFADDAIATTGTRYVRALFYVSGFPIDRPLESQTTIDGELKLAYGGAAPAWTTVGS